ncbi:MAG: hypothetical protein N4Q30_07800 [Neisseriaceae bacterium]|nr:hypothetical protein [Neisseriaceae bacterium]
MKKYLLFVLTPLFFVSCNEAENIKPVHQKTDNVHKVTNDSNQGDTEKFFNPKEYEGTKEENKCIDNSNGDFAQLKICTDLIIKNIKEHINQKLISLNKSPAILNTEYKKIINKCNKELDDESPSLEKDFLISDCIEYDLYQFDRNLK